MYVHGFRNKWAWRLQKAKRVSNERWKSIKALQKHTFVHKVGVAYAKGVFVKEKGGASSKGAEPKIT